MVSARATCYSILSLIPHDDNDRASHGIALHLYVSIYVFSFSCSPRTPHASCTSWPDVCVCARQQYTCQWKWKMIRTIRFISRISMWCLHICHICHDKNRFFESQTQKVKSNKWNYRKSIAKMTCEWRRAMGASAHRCFFYFISRKIHTK